MVYRKKHPVLANQFLLCVTTERPEAVKSGTVELVGTDIEKIKQKVDDLIVNDAVYAKFSKAHNPYGDGNACKRILEFLINKDI